MKIFSPHRRKMEAKRKYGSKEFQNKIKKAQDYKRVFDPRANSALAVVLRFLHLESRFAQVAVVAVVLVLGYYLMISSQLLVQEIVVTGTERLNTEQVQSAISSAGQHRWFFIPKNHLLLLSKSYAQELIRAELPLVKEIDHYKRIWPNKIEVGVVERRPGFAFNVGGANYLVDEEGVVVKELQDATGLIQVIDQVSETVEIGEQLTNAKMVGFILSALHKWPSKINPQLKEIKVFGKAASFAQFMASEGWGVFLDFNRPVDGQLSNLNLILTKQIPAQSRLKLAHIDLRFENKAYYCYKDSPCESGAELLPPETENPDAPAESGTPQAKPQPEISPKTP